MRRDVRELLQIRVRAGQIGHRLAELRFGLLALGDVVEHTDINRFPVLAAVRRNVHLHPNDRAVRPMQPRLDLDEGRRGRLTRPLLDHSRALIVRQELHPIGLQRLV